MRGTPKGSLSRVTVHHDRLEEIGSAKKWEEHLQSLNQLSGYMALEVPFSSIVFAGAGETGPP